MRKVICFHDPNEEDAFSSNRSFSDVVKDGVKYTSVNDKRRAAVIRKELASIEKQESKLRQAALKAKPAAWKTELEKKIPEKVYTGLESAFCKGFSVVFNQGSALIERSYNKEDLKADHAIRDYAVQLKGGRKEFRQMRQNAKSKDFLNLAVTTVEGIGLGALGVGMPDIVLFISTLLKGIYETALNYGFEYESRQEQLLILKMMETAMSTGDAWVQKNTEVSEMLELETIDITDELLECQMKATASLFAMDMLLLKFIQGMPVVGIIGGAANPVYYSKVMKYVQTKYRKRYLLKHTSN